MTRRVIAYGREWPSASVVVEAERCVDEGRCVNCGQYLDGRIILAWTDALLRIAQLEAELSAALTQNAALRAGGVH